MIEVQLDLHNVAAAERWLVNIGHRLTDFSPVFRGSFKEAVKQFFRRQWETEGGEGGHRWPPDSFATLVQRRERGLTSMKPLWATGRLRESFTAEGGANVFSAQATLMRWGSRLPYAAKQQATRPIVPATLPTHEIQEFERVLMAWMTRGEK